MLSIIHSEPAPVEPSEDFSGLPVIRQIERAFSPGHRLAGFTGLIIGGAIPAISFELVHYEVHRNPWLWALIAGGLIYSAVTVFQWVTLAFGNAFKALGFVTLSEGAMVLSHNPYVSFGVLALLIFVNATSAACQLQVRQDVTPVTPVQSLGITVKNLQSVTLSSRKHKREQARIRQQRHRDNKRDTLHVTA